VRYKIAIGRGKKSQLLDKVAITCFIFLLCGRNKPPYCLLTIVEIKMKIGLPYLLFKTYAYLIFFLWTTKEE